jgi:hypothetical protein
MNTGERIVPKKSNLVFLVVGKDHNGSPVSSRLEYKKTSHPTTSLDRYCTGLLFSPAPGLVMMSSLIRVYADGNLIHKARMVIAESPSERAAFFKLKEETRIKILFREASIALHNAQVAEHLIKSELVKTLSEVFQTRPTDLFGDGSAMMFTLKKPETGIPEDPEGGIN